jgi:hypothetical protein
MGRRGHDEEKEGKSAAAVEGSSRAISDRRRVEVALEAGSSIRSVLPDCGMIANGSEGMNQRRGEESSSLDDGE